MALGNLDAAENDLAMAIKLYPMDTDGIFLSRVGMYQKKHDPEKALLDLNKAVELNPKHSRAWWKRGNLFFRGRQDKGSYKRL